MKCLASFNLSSFLTVVLHTLLTLIICRAKGSSVSLTVEGGVSLVGPHCPGTIRLFCEGVDLVSLEWNFNVTNTTISSFFPDDKVTIRMTSNAAFLYAQLVSISQSSNPVFGNFTSILKVDLSQLRQQHITLIRCGDSGTSKALPVDVQIYQLSIPLNPQMVKVYASFDSSEFVSLTVSWNLPDGVCSQYQQHILYEATLKGGGLIPTTKQIEAGSCSLVCNVSFTMTMVGDGNLLLQLQARGSNDTVEKSVFIGNRRIGDSCVRGIAAATMVTLLLSIFLAVTLGLGIYCYSSKKNCSKFIRTRHRFSTKKQKSKSEINFQKNLSYGKVRKVTRTPAEQATQNDIEHCETEPPVELQVNQSYKNVQKVKKVNEMVYSEPSDPEHSKPAPYEEPIVSTEKVKIKTKDKVNQTERARGTTMVGRSNDNVNLKENQSYGQLGTGESNTMPDYDYIDM